MLLLFLFFLLPTRIVRLQLDKTRFTQRCRQKRCIAASEPPPSAAACVVEPAVWNEEAVWSNFRAANPFSSETGRGEKTKESRKRRTACWLDCLYIALKECELFLFGGTRERREQDASFLHPQTAPLHTPCSPLSRSIIWAATSQAAWWIESIH